MTWLLASIHAHPWATGVVVVFCGMIGYLYIVLFITDDIPEE